MEIILIYDFTVKKQPDEETLKRIQEYIDKKAAEKK